MDEIRDVALEFVRPGPAHNQLLSPLTHYVGLCGGDGPVTVNLPYEHRQLLLRLSRLRYELAADGRETEAQRAQRQGELHDIGETLGEVLGGIPALLGELSRIRRDGGKLMHLRLSLSAAELGMVPFETAIAPTGFPGSGSPLFLQTDTPICVTREIRRGQPLPLDWNREPKVLFAYAQPAGLDVPYWDHLTALHQALSPWIRKKDKDEDRVAEVRKSLTVLPNASLQDIRNQCALESFTHVHILAHGIPDPQVGEIRFGLALCRDDDKDKLDKVSGTSLAYALLSRSCPGGQVQTPHLVSLATCDSGNQGTVLVPGGSIAHDLHTAGIPWVIASQFPLWMSASTLLVRELYQCMLEGADPRWVLYGTRQKLYTDCPEHHDWASVVAYAAVPPDFGLLVAEFRDAQMRRRMNVRLDRLDDLVRTLAEGSALQDRPASVESRSEFQGRLGEIEKELDQIVAELNERLETWSREVRSDGGATQLRNPELAERIGLLGACDKRAAIAWSVFSKTDATEDKRAVWTEKSAELYQVSYAHYAEALEYDPTNTWLITQFLCMAALLEPRIKGHVPKAPLGIRIDDWWTIVEHLAKVELERSHGHDRAYALGTMAELCLLSTVYAPSTHKQAKKDLREYLDQLMALGIDHRIPLIATRRQFERYKKHWADDRWEDLATTGADMLG